MKLLRLPFIAMFAYAVALVGCGQKGDLYLPEKQTPPKIVAEPTTQAETTTVTDVATEPPVDETNTAENIDETNQ